MIQNKYCLTVASFWGLWVNYENIPVMHLRKKDIFFFKKYLRIYCSFWSKFFGENVQSYVFIVHQFWINIYGTVSTFQHGKTSFIIFLFPEIPQNMRSFWIKVLRENELFVVFIVHQSWINIHEFEKSFFNIENILFFNSKIHQNSLPFLEKNGSQYLWFIGLNFEPISRIFKALPFCNQFFYNIACL